MTLFIGKRLTTRLLAGVCFYIAVIFPLLGQHHKTIQAAVALINEQQFGEAATLLHEIVAKNHNHAAANLALASLYELSYKYTPVYKNSQADELYQKTLWFYQQAATFTNRKDFRKYRAIYESVLGRGLKKDDYIALINKHIARCQARNDSARQILALRDHILLLHTRVIHCSDSLNQALGNYTMLYYMEPSVNALADSAMQSIAELQTSLQLYNKWSNSWQTMLTAQQIELRQINSITWQPIFKISELFSLQAEKLTLSIPSGYIKQVVHTVKVKIPSLMEGYHKAEKNIGEHLRQFGSVYNIYSNDVLSYNTRRDLAWADSMEVYQAGNLLSNLVRYKAHKIKLMETALAYDRYLLYEGLSLEDRYTNELLATKYIHQCDSLLRRIGNTNLQKQKHYMCEAERWYSPNWTTQEYMKAEGEFLRAQRNTWTERLAKSRQIIDEMSSWGSFKEKRIVFFTEPYKQDSLMNMGHLVCKTIKWLPDMSFGGAGFYRKPGSSTLFVFVFMANADMSIRWLHMPHDAFIEEVWPALQLYVSQSGVSLMYGAIRPEAGFWAGNLTVDFQGNLIYRYAPAQGWSLATLVPNIQNSAMLISEVSGVGHQLQNRVSIVNKAGQVLYNTQLPIQGNIVAGIATAKGGYILVGNFTELTDPSHNKVVESRAFKLGGANVVFIHLDSKAKIQRIAPVFSENTLAATDVEFTNNKIWIAKGLQAADPLLSPELGQGENWRKVINEF